MSTPKEKIRRRIQRIENSGQLSFFGVGCAVGKGEGPAREDPQAVSFQDPDPSRILVGDGPLGDYLRSCGEVEVFRLREFLREQDWSEFEKSYRAGGRRAFAPVLMVGLIVYGLMLGRSSLRELEREARFNVRLWWLTGGVSPDHSVIGRFIARHGELLGGVFFEELTARIVKECSGSGGDVAIDGGVVQAAATAYRLLRRESLERYQREAAEEVSENPQDEESGERLRQCEKLLQVLSSREESRRGESRKISDVVVCPSEPDAVYQPLKNKARRPSYKPSVAVNSQRVIVAWEVDPSSEQQALPKLLEQAMRVLPEGVDRVLMDGNYFCQAVAEPCRDGGIEMLSPPDRPRRGPYWPKQAFCYHFLGDYYLCPANEKLSFLTRGSSQGRAYRIYGTKACQQCPMLKSCTRSPRGRRIKRYELDSYLEQVAERMRRPQMQALYRKRMAWVEPVLGEIQHLQKLSRFRRRGLAQVRLEYGLHATAHNLRRWLKLSAPCQEFWAALWAPTGGKLATFIDRYFQHPFLSRLIACT